MSELSQEIVAAVGPGTEITPEQLVRVHVSSFHLSASVGDERPEANLYAAMRQDSRQPQRRRVVGEAGSGKTSLIMRAVSEGQAGVQRPEVLVLRCGEDPTRLESPAEFLRLMIGTILSQEKFASVDPAALAEAASVELTSTPATGSHTGGIGGGAVPVQYQFSWQEAVSSLTSEPSAEQRRAVLTDTLNAAAEHGPLTVVVDDTDRFAAPGANGEIDTVSIHNLFEHGLKTLLEMPVNIVVAVHPAYGSVPTVRTVLERGEFVDIEVPALPVDHDIDPLSTILKRRLEVRVSGIDPDPLRFFERDALVQLQAAYFGAHDLRRVLRRCQASAQLALNRDADRVSIADVQRELDLPSTD